MGRAGRGDGGLDGRMVFLEKGEEEATHAPKKKRQKEKKKKTQASRGAKKKKKSRGAATTGGCGGVFSSFFFLLLFLLVLFFLLMLLSVAAVGLALIAYCVALFPLVFIKPGVSFPLFCSLPALPPPACPPRKGRRKRGGSGDKIQINSFNKYTQYRMNK